MFIFKHFNLTHYLFHVRIGVKSSAAQTKLNKDKTFVNLTLKHLIGTINLEVAFLFLNFLSDWERRKQFREIKEINLGQKTCNVRKINNDFLPYILE